MFRPVDIVTLSLVVQTSPVGCGSPITVVIGLREIERPLMNCRGARPQNCIPFRAWVDLRQAKIESIRAARMRLDVAADHLDVVVGEFLELRRILLFVGSFELRLRKIRRLVAGIAVEVRLLEFRNRQNVVGMQFVDEVFSAEDYPVVLLHPGLQLW